MVDLLTYARKAVGEDLISNLRGNVNIHMLPAVFRGVDRPEDYSLDEWNDAISYVLNQKLKEKIKSREELYRLIGLN